MILIRRRLEEELLFIMKCLGNHSSQVRTRMLVLFDSPQSAAFQRCCGKIFYPRCLTFKHHDDHHEERLLFIVKCFCNRSLQVWIRMLAMEIWKLSISHEKQVVLYDQRGTRCWAVLVDLLAGAAASSSVWVVWGGGGATIWCLVMRTYSKLAEGLEVWKKSHITRAKPLTHCFFSYWACAISWRKQMISRARVGSCYQQLQQLSS